MALLAFWHSSPESVLSLTVQQVLSNAGDGKLRDGSPCSDELREFLGEIESAQLARYVRQCLDASFENSGLVLQDLVNEIGRRLEFEVDNGLYRGKQNAVGYDGIWRSKESPAIIIEVKTTDYVAVSLDKIAEYKRRLVYENKVADDASMLIVVGREDTGAIEAQVRGSRYAWSMRLISAESLCRLLSIKEQSDEDSTVRQIKELLRPFEYTKVDKIIDVIFATSEDVAAATGEPLSLGESASADADNAPTGHSVTNREELNAKRQRAADALAKRIGRPLVRVRQASYQDATGAYRVCAAVSKRYDREHQPYWYAFHPTWKAFLEGGQTSFFLLTCMDRDEAYAIPLDVVLQHLDGLYTTTRADGTTYWHIALGFERGSLVWSINKWAKKVPLAPYVLSIQ
jgi:hypothetical protein